LKQFPKFTVGHTTTAGTSVLDDLNLDRGFIVKAKLAIRIQKTVQEMGLNQRDAALSQLTRGKFDGLSQAKLEECLVALGHDVIINIGPRHAGVGLRRVEERVFG
jgi:predicted XRE-type DNA-binding protein